MTKMRSKNTFSSEISRQTKISNFRSDVLVWTIKSQGTAIHIVRELTARQSDI